MAKKRKHQPGKPIDLNSAAKRSQKILNMTFRDAEAAAFDILQEEGIEQIEASLPQKAKGNAYEWDVIIDDHELAGRYRFKLTVMQVS